MYCGKCGAKLRENSKFCGSCGRSLGQAATALQSPEPTVETRPVPAPEQSDPPKAERATDATFPERTDRSSTADLNRASEPPRSFRGIAIVVIAALIGGVLAIFAMRGHEAEVLAPAAVKSAPAPVTPAVSPKGAAVAAVSVPDSAPSPKAPAQCYNVSRGEPHTLEGTLSSEIFAGRPGFDDVRKGDDPESSYVLRLSQPICIQSDDKEDGADPNNPISKVQLSPQDFDKNIRAKMRAALGYRVQVILASAQSAITGHHHEPLVASVHDLTLLDAASRAALIPRAYPPVEQSSDESEELGTAATTVRGFYAALSFGNGEAASQFVVPEKRNAGPYTPQSISAFYGPLPEPLQLLHLKALAPNEFLVSYRFALNNRRCNGRAKVLIARREGQNLIEKISPLDGC